MTAFNSECQHDLFISYGVVDDQPTIATEPGWVSTFVHDLRTRLSKRLGRKDTFSIWRDQQNLSRHSDITKEIKHAIEQSACLLVIYSPSYLRSHWCRRELVDFLSDMGNRARNGSPIFLIECEWVGEEKPAEFQNLLGYQFWTGDPTDVSNPPRPLDKKLPPDLVKYTELVNQVTHAVATELCRLKKEAIERQSSVVQQTVVVQQTTVGQQTIVAQQTTVIEQQVTGAPPTPAAQEQTPAPPAAVELQAVVEQLTSINPQAVVEPQIAIPNLVQPPSEPVVPVASVPSVPSPAPVRTGRAAKATVFLAEVTDDLRKLWNRMRTELDSRGVRVISAGSPRDAATMEKAVTTALQESSYFVQLLSEVTGQPLAGSRESYAHLQFRLAGKLNKKIKQWRAPDVTEKSFDEQIVEIRELSDKHRQLLFGQARAEQFEDFKRHIVQLTTPSRVLESKAGRQMVFISLNTTGSSSDLGLSVDLLGYLNKLGYGIVGPADVDDRDPVKFQADFQNSVLSSKGWIVVYGEHTDKYWVRGQVNAISQVLCEHNRHMELIHLCAGPPAPKDVKSPFSLVGMQLPGMKVLDFQGGFIEEGLFPFLDTLTVSAAESSSTVAEPEQSSVI